MVPVGIPPARKIAESISARSISEVSVFPLQRSFFPDPGFSNSQGTADHFDFLVRFRFAFRPEKPVCRAHTDFIRGELLGVAKREICRNDYRFYTAPSQEMREHFFIRRRVFGLSLRLALELTKHDKFICIGLLASSIDLEIAQDQRAFAVSLQENKWIR